MIEFPKSIEATMISPDFRVVFSPSSFSLTDEEKKKVEAYWRLEKKKGEKHLFNGQLLSLLEFGDEELVGEFVPYKAYIAQLADAEIAREINICPICVSGIVISEGHVLLGRRSKLVTNYPNHYELVPSGSISTQCCSQNSFIDYRKQLLLELFEETKIIFSQADEVFPFALMKEASHSLIDICMLVRLSERIAYQVTEEYPDLIWLPSDEVKKFVEKRHSQFIPTSLAMLSIAKGFKWI